MRSTIMAINTIVCVLLLSCYTSDSPLKPEEFNCPDHCSCYKAPEGGDGTDTAYSLECDWNSNNNFDAKQYESIKSESINTFIIDNVITVPDGTDHPGETANVLSGFSITNLVFRKSNLDFISFATLENINKNDLKVLTFIDSELNNVRRLGISLSNLEHFRKFDQVKAIHISGGSFKKMDNQFVSDSVANVVSITVDNTGLQEITNTAFLKFIKLKMLTITRNSITILEWLKDLPPGSPLWYLDLRNNLIREFPLDLAEKLNRLKVLKLGGNNIHIIGKQTAYTLINQLRELSFKSYPGTTRKDYFYPTADMKWIHDFMDHHSLKNDFQNYPHFLHESLQKLPCVEWNNNELLECNRMDPNYEYPNQAITNEMTIINEKLSFSFKNELALLNGAVLPIDNNEDVTPWFEKVLNAQGNVVKIHLDTREWYAFGHTDTDAFDIMVNNLEEDLREGEMKGIFFIINLWESKHLTPPLTTELIHDSSIFQDYATNHLTPLVTRLNKFKSLLAWNLLDEPEKFTFDNSNDQEKCFNTQSFQQIVPGKGHMKIKHVQEFLAKQAKIIHNIGPRKLVTATFSSNNALRSFRESGVGFNHFEDLCLSKSIGGHNCPNNDCTLDFYTISISKGVWGSSESFIPADLSKESPKPVVVIADENFGDLTEIIDNQYNGLWRCQGVMGTFTSKFEDPSNDKIAHGINEFSNLYPKLILRPNYMNNILDEN